MTKLPPIPWNRDFYLDTYRCRCGECKAHFGQRDRLAEVHVRLVLIADLLEERTATPQRFMVNSAVRCWAHNRAEDGAKRSLHLSGEALDLHPMGCTVQELFDAARTVRGDFSALEKQGGIGRYYTFVHIDVRENGCATKLTPEGEWHRGRGERG